MAFDKKLLDILACPSCKGALFFDDQTNELLCRFDKLAFPIRDNIPVMLIDEARQLNQGETP